MAQFIKKKKLTRTQEKEKRKRDQKNEKRKRNQGKTTRGNTNLEAKLVR